VIVALRTSAPSPGELSECLEDGQAPIAIRLIDLEDDLDGFQLPLSRSGKAYSRLLAFLRREGSPLGWIAVPVSPSGDVSLGALAETLEPFAKAAVGAGDVLGGSDGLGALRGNLQPEPATEQMLSVVVATCADAESIICCVEAIQAGATGPYEIIVVENRPAHSTVRGALEERFGDDERIRYVEERRPGLACARNAGLYVACGELVAFTDDDVIVDPAWVPAIRAAFAATPEVDCVTGLILPLELETPAQILVERFASYGKGLIPRVYSLDEPPIDQPLFPYTAGYFVSGANMAFRTAVLRDLGGYDPVLGTGTHARGGEDFDICIRLLHAKGRLAYEPRAIIWHRHPSTHEHLRRRAFDYGAALGAILTKHVITGPDRWAIVSRARAGIRYYTDPNSRKNAARGPVFPRSLTRLERAGLVYGPVAYLASRFEAWR
jgi:O-antigen biosynthesis protein